MIFQNKFDLSSACHSTLSSNKRKRENATDADAPNGDVLSSMSYLLSSSVTSFGSYCLSTFSYIFN